MTSDNQRHTRESATRRIHDELGLARLSPTWAKIEILLGLAAASTGLLIGVAASVYLVYVLEILKLKRFRTWQLRRENPDTSEHEIDEHVERELETGEFRSLTP